MICPLRGGRSVENLPTGGNQGLYFNKFFDQWANGFEEVIKPSGEFLGGKQAWLKKFERELVGASEAANRINNLARALGGEAREFTTTGPFITGMGLSNPIENGFLWHHTLGVPYLPGSSVKGMIRAWAEEWEGEDSAVIGRLFGRDDKAEGGSGAGNIIVFDALPTKTLALYTEVITPHTGDWRITDKPENSPPADWVSPTPIPFLAVKEGAEFQFALAPRKGAKENDLEKAFEYLHEALEWIGAGAKTSVGFGRFKDASILLEEKNKEKNSWFENLKDGDDADYFGQRVRLREVDLVEGKVGLVNIDKNKSLGRKDIAKLKPWKG